MQAQVDAAVEDPARDERARRERWRRQWSACWPVLALVVAAGIVAIVVHHWIYPAYSWNRDEPVYLWQVHALRDGQILPTDGGHPAFFQPWLSGHGDGYFFSQYTLGWPIVLLVGEVLLGTAASALVFGAMLAVLGTYAFAKTITGNRAVSLVSAALLLLSPMLAAQSGTYLGYLFTYGLGTLFGAALITGFERRRPGLLAAAGGCVGWIFMTRPFDAVLWAAAFGGYLVIVHRRELRRLAAGAGWASLGALPLVVATLLYNRKVTGSFTEFPITAADPLDTFGFGLVRLMPVLGKEDYTVEVAVRSTVKNSLVFPLFLFGSYLGVVVAGFGLWMRRRQRTTIALLLLLVAFPLGYFFFWGMHVSSVTAQISGPIYFMPLFGPIVVLIATALVAWWRQRRTSTIVVVAVLAVITAAVGCNRLALNHRFSEAQIPWRDGTESVEGRALVFGQQAGPYLLLLNPFSSNDADLDGRILYSTDHGAADLDLIAEHPDRTPYLQQTSIPPATLTPEDDPVTPKVTLRRLRVLDTAVATLHVRVTNPSSSPVVAVSLTVGDHVEHRVLATDSTKGATYDVEWQVAASEAAPVTGAVDVPGGYGTATVGLGYGHSVGAARDPVARQVVPLKSGTGLQLLLPSQGARAGTIDDQPGWYERRSLPELRVRVTG